MKKFLLTLGQLMRNPQVRNTALPLGGLSSLGLGTYGISKIYDAAYGPNGEKLDPDPDPKPAPKSAPDLQPTAEDPLPYLNPSNVDKLLAPMDRSIAETKATLNNLEDQMIASGVIPPIEYLESRYGKSEPLNVDELVKKGTNPDIKDLMKESLEAQEAGLDEETKQALYTSLLTGGLGAGLGALLSSSRRGLGALAGGAVGGALPLLYKYYKDNYANKSTTH